MIIAKVTKNSIDGDQRTSKSLAGLRLEFRKFRTAKNLILEGGGNLTARLP